jgi:DNA modification methylase
MTTDKRYEEVAINKLVPYARNPRVHSKQQIAQIRASFREFGTIAPIICDETYSVLAGHGRLMAAQEEGLETINCLVVEGLTETQKRAYVITDNKMTENSDWDEELLNLEMQALQEDGFNMELTGFNEHDIAVLLGSSAAVTDDDYDVNGALEKAAFVETGDVWTVGKHRLICGDCSDFSLMQKLMNGKTANLIVTDPPYNVAFQSTEGMKIQNDKMSEEQFYEFLKEAFMNMHACLDNEGSIYVFHSDGEVVAFRKAFADAGFYWSCNIIWNKGHFALSRGDYHSKHEPCFYGWKNGGKHKWYAGRDQSTVWDANKPNTAKENGHPTSKPLDLIAKPIQNSSFANAVVLDPFGGSGSTMMACEQTDRICCTMEIDPKYCSVILRRYADTFGDTENITCERDGEILHYTDLVKEVEEQ